MKIEDIRDTRTIKISKGDVELFDSYCYGDIEKISKIKDDANRGFRSLACLIKKWSFDDEVNDENIGKLKIEDITELMKAVSDISKSIISSKKKEIIQ